MSWDAKFHLWRLALFHVLKSDLDFVAKDRGEYNFESSLLIFFRRISFHDEFVLSVFAILCLVVEITPID